jgi:hypothetical protein
MDNPTSTPVEEETSNLDSSLGAELSKLANQQSSKLTPMENNAERIRASVARLSSSSIDELQGLVAELQTMQEFLKSEVNGVQRQIDNALAGINIIIETIGPWKNIASSQTPPYGNRIVRGGPAANIEATQSRRVAGTEVTSG